MTKQPIKLSKTDYILFRECHKNVWLKKHKPDLYYKAELSEFEKSIIETGNEVEIEARKLFPTGILIEGRDDEALKMTQNHITKKTPVLFQAIFSKDNFLAASDILTYDSKTESYFLFEVKATNDVDDKTHIYDLAFQCNLLEKFDLKISKIFVIHLNSKYIRKGKIDIVKLFEKTDVTEKVNKLKEDVLKEMYLALDYLSKDSEPVGFCDCVYKGKSRHCTTFKYSNPEILDSDYTVHDIARIGLSKAKLTELIDSNIFYIKDIPDTFKLSETQRNQVDATIFDRVTINKEKIREEFDSLIFPLYFLDYETFPSAIPRFDNFSPYQQIPFQYSLHVVESKKTAYKEPKHFDFLYTKEGDPSHDFVKSMQKHIGKIGSIIVWHKSFECGRNKELGDRIPEYKNFLEEINNRVYDLEDIFKKQYHIHKDFRGSSSIKKVLPVLVPSLSYKDLEIREGGAAAQSWNKITSNKENNSFDDFEKETIEQNLKDYCKLDTYAMYAIWLELYKLL